MSHVKTEKVVDSVFGLGRGGDGEQTESQIGALPLWRRILTGVLQNLEDMAWGRRDGGTGGPCTKPHYHLPCFRCRTLDILWELQAKGGGGGVMNVFGGGVSTVSFALAVRIEGRKLCSTENSEPHSVEAYGWKLVASTGGGKGGCYRVVW